MMFRIVNDNLNPYLYRITWSAKMLLSVKVLLKLRLKWADNKSFLITGLRSNNFNMLMSSVKK